MNAILAGSYRVQPGSAAPREIRRDRIVCWWRALVASAVSLVVPALAQDYSTINRDALGHFWAVAEQRLQPVTVVSFGDSMADSYRSVTFHLMNKMIGRFGVAGYSLNNYANTALVNLTNGAFPVPGGDYWHSYYTGVPSGGAVWWENQPTPGGVYCDQAGIFYVAQPAGGPFRLSLSTNGGPWMTSLLLNGFSPTPVGRFAKLALPPNQYRLRVDGDGGTNYIIGPHLLMTQASGVHVVFMDQGGIPLGAVTNVPLAIREPIFSALQPDLLVWHMKEPTDLGSGTSNRMEECERWWTNSAPDCDILYLGTPWAAVDTNSTTTLDQNSVVRYIALKYHRAYVDLMQPTFNYPWLLTNGFMADATHLNSAGGLYCANLLWNDLDFFALGLPRRLTLSAAGPQLQLTYDTAADAVYQLEVSTNLTSWSAVFTNPVGLATFTTNFLPPAPPAYYRLQLTPN